MLFLQLKIGTIEAGVHFSIHETRYFGYNKVKLMSFNMNQNLFFLSFFDFFHHKEK
jgi:hypothetical protein